MIYYLLGKTITTKYFKPRTIFATKTTKKYLTNNNYEIISYTEDQISGYYRKFLNNSKLILYEMRVDVTLSL